MEAYKACSCSAWTCSDESGSSVFLMTRMAAACGPIGSFMRSAVPACAIASVLGVDQRTVASHLCRGIEELHKIYLEEAITNGDRR